MASYRAQILSTKPAKEVFDYLAVFSNAAEWDPGVESATRDGEGPATLGEKFHLLVKMGSKTSPMTYEIIELEPGRVVLRAETDRLVSLDTITVRESPAGTLMDYQAELDIKGSLKVLDPLLGLLFKRIGDKAVDGLREHTT